MNQQCKVCGEPAAGFHFGAFTCEGCKSFFGRSYNNLNSITECKNNGECIINKKNRTACKSCRLRKCLLVGMSKSGSRYGRRSNWFKIHCLLQEQQQAAVAQMKGKNPTSASSPLENSLPLLSPLAFPHPNLGTFLRPNNSSSPSVSSPDSDSSEPGPYSPRMNGTSSFVNKDFYLPVPFHSMFMQPPSMASPFLLPPSLIPFPVPPAKRSDYSQRLASPDHVQNLHKKSSTPDLAGEERIRSSSPPQPRHSPTNNNDYSSKYSNHNKLNVGDDYKNKCNNNNNFGMNNKNIDSKNDKVTVRSKRFYLDAILGLKDVPEKDPEPEIKEEEIDGEDEDEGRERRRKMSAVEGEEDEQDNPIDLSLKSSTFKSDVSSLQNCCRKTEEMESEEREAGTEVKEDDVEEEEEEELEEDVEEDDMKPKISYSNHDELKPIPLDLTV